MDPKKLLPLLVLLAQIPVPPEHDALDVVPCLKKNKGWINCLQTNKI